jgi:hypothetical protein
MKRCKNLLFLLFTLGDSFILSKNIYLKKRAEMRRVQGREMLHFHRQNTQIQFDDLFPAGWKKREEERKE